MFLHAAAARVLDFFFLSICASLFYLSLSSDRWNFPVQLPGVVLAVNGDFEWCMMFSVVFVCFVFSISLIYFGRSVIKLFPSEASPSDFQIVDIPCVNLHPKHTLSIIYISLSLYISLCSNRENYPLFKRKKTIRNCTSLASREKKQINMLHSLS
uniref:Uncharacterized protein n=1 Tax=Oryza brachyantha TaxID=4533 RepID=J3MXP9_ORYBR